MGCTSSIPKSNSLKFHTYSEGDMGTLQHQLLCWHK